LRVETSTVASSICMRCGISFASRLARNGVGLAQAQRLLGTRTWQ
jgi:hypothetical protein